jgi:hypothetical protein
MYADCYEDSTRARFWLALAGTEWEALSRCVFARCHAAFGVSLVMCVWLAPSAGLTAVGSMRTSIGLLAARGSRAAGALVGSRVQLVALSPASWRRQSVFAGGGLQHVAIAGTQADRLRES